MKLSIKRSTTFLKYSLLFQIALITTFIPLGRSMATRELMNESYFTQTKDYSKALSNIIPQDITEESVNVNLSRLIFEIDRFDALITGGINIAYYIY